MFQSWEGRVKAAALILAIPLAGGKGETGQGRACPVLLELKLRGGGVPVTLPPLPPSLARTESHDHNKPNDHAGELYH